MHLKKYIYKFGDKSFDEFPFGNVDGALFAYLAYPCWEIVAPGIDNIDGKPFCFDELTPENIKKLIVGSPTPNQHRRLLTAIIKTKRYKGVKIKFIEEKFSFEKKQQYYALTYEIPGVGHYICFRGTDLTILGWEENFRLTLKTQNPSQIDAVQYINKVAEKIKGNFYIGGHSKGGNLSIFAGVNISPELQDRVIKIFSIDGPGFYSKEIYETESYKRIEDKVFHVIPKNSIVGVCFHTPKHFKVVGSRTVITILQHSPYGWSITKEGKFKYRNKRSFMTFVRHRTLTKWLENESEEVKQLTIDAMVTALGGNDKTLLLYIKHPWLIAKTIVRFQKKYTKEQKKILSKFSGKFVKSYFGSFFYYLKKKRRDLSDE